VGSDADLVDMKKEMNLRLSALNQRLHDLRETDSKGGQCSHGQGIGGRGTERSGQQPGFSASSLNALTSQGPLGLRSVHYPLGRLLRPIEDIDHSPFFRPCLS
jgi:hypothetical protein